MLGRWSLWRSLAGLMFAVGHQPSRDAIERVGLAGKIAERVSRLSGGEQQRVALARMLVQDPAVTLADEPVASLDPALADDLLRLLRDITSEQGRTVVASLHIPDMARRYFDRVIALSSGRVEFDMSAGDVTDSMLGSLYELNGRSRDPEPVGDAGTPIWGR